jgi:hypothetical protein
VVPYNFHRLFEDMHGQWSNSQRPRPQMVILSQQCNRIERIATNLSPSQPLLPKKLKLRSTATSKRIAAYFKRIATE